MTEGPTVPGDQEVCLGRCPGHKAPGGQVAAVTQEARGVPPGDPPHKGLHWAEKWGEVSTGRAHWPLGLGYGPSAGGP